MMTTMTPQFTTAQGTAVSAPVCPQADAAFTTGRERDVLVRVLGAPAVVATGNPVATQDVTGIDLPWYRHVDCSAVVTASGMLPGSSAWRPPN